MDYISAILVIALFLIGDSEAAWEYTGPSGQGHWHDSYPVCGESAQSPIDIETESALPDPTLTGFQFTNYDVPVSGEFSNNGHSVKLGLLDSKAGISRGGLESDYFALQLHFHWRGADSDGGSEHTVNEKRYDAEMHIVHMMEGLSALDDTKPRDDGLAVLGVFMQADPSNPDNPYYEPLFQAITNVYEKDSTTQLSDGPPLITLLPQSEDFYRYMGSLTTPPCYETVVWTVFKQPVQISIRQILQSVLSGHDNDHIADNFRDEQPLGKRIVSEYLDTSFDMREQTGGWHYEGMHGPGHWPSMYPICGQKKQSPVDIMVTKLRKSSADTELTLDGYGDEISGEFINNGHTVKLNFNSNVDYKMSGGGLNGTYQAAQLHFHWGTLNAKGRLTGGSEHTVDGNQFAAEMHIVHTKKDADSNAADKNAVLGVFVRLKDDDDKDEDKTDAIDDLFSYIQDLAFTDDDSNVRSGPSLSDILPDGRTFYRYMGSLTTPPCSQTVVWTILTEPMIITTKQFIAFQRIFALSSSSIHPGNHLNILQLEAMPDYTPAVKSVKLNESVIPIAKALVRDNYRPTQPYNGRTVYVYGQENELLQPEPTPVVLIVVYIIAGIAAFAIFAAIALKCWSKKQSGYQGHGTGFAFGSASPNKY